MTVPGITFGRDGGFRPGRSSSGARLYDGGLVTITVRRPSPFPPLRVQPPHIPPMSRSTSSRIGPIRDGGGFRTGLHPYIPGPSSNPGLAANQAALERARAADRARTETMRQNAERARQTQDNLRRSAERARQMQDSLRQTTERARRHMPQVAGQRPPPPGRLGEVVLPRRRGAANAPAVATWGGPNGLPSTVPQSRAMAPSTMELAPALFFQLSDLRDRTLASGKSPGARSEYGQLIAIDTFGRIALMGPPIAGAKDHVRMDPHRQILKRSAKDGSPVQDDSYKVIGIAHTHPVSNNFSGADIASFANERNDRVNLVVGRR